MKRKATEKNFTPIHINVSKHPPHVVYGVKGVLLGVIILFFLFLIINIVASQTISPMYFNFITENRQDAVTFLKEAQELPDYKTIYATQKGIYGDNLDKDVYQVSWNRRDQIQHYEDLLQKNPEARDLLYELYTLYYEDHDMNKAQQYLQRAQQVDPMVQKELGL